jgi:2-alkenal reductase
MDNFSWYTPEPEEEPRRKLSGFLIGALVGAITLMVIVALVLGMVGYFFLPKDNKTNPLTRNRYQPSAADLRNANYRPSDWTQPTALQFQTPTPVSPEIIAEADAEHLLLINLYERVNPSVVNIEIVSRAHVDIQDVPEGIIDSSGSGFVLDLDGHIVTNSHVVREAEEILVTFYDGYMAEAELVGIDDYSDLAVIQIDPAGAPLIPVELGDSNILKVGQRVVAIGNPFGLDGSMTVGIVSAVGRSLPSAQLLDPTTYDQYDNPSIIQVDAAVNPGNSGGPLLDSYGRVIGVNTAIRTETGTFEGIAFAVPVNTLKRVVPQLISAGHAEYSYLGITSPNSGRGVSMSMLANELGFPVNNGVLINEVLPDSPAARAGLRGGTQTTVVRGIEVPTDSDIIVAINGNLVRDIDDLVAYLVENTSPGDVVVLTIVREGNTLDLDVTLDRRPG